MLHNSGLRLLHKFSSLRCYIISFMHINNLKARYDFKKILIFICYIKEPIITGCGMFIDCRLLIKIMGLKDKRYEYKCHKCGDVVLLKGEPMHPELSHKGRCPYCGHSGKIAYYRTPSFIPRRGKKIPYVEPSEIEPFDPWGICVLCGNRCGLALHVLQSNNKEWKGVDRVFRHCNPRYNGCGEKFYVDGGD